MELNKKTAELICELEHIIGRKCYNAKSYNSWANSTGHIYRYPVWINRNEEGTAAYNTRAVARFNNPEYVKSLKYKFGANQLYIGKGIIEILEYLEVRYDIDFSKLETAITPGTEE